LLPVIIVYRSYGKMLAEELETQGITEEEIDKLCFDQISFGH